LRALLFKAMTSPENGAPRGVCLVGFMGAGKTSIGRLLARRLHWPFIDLDEVIQSREHRSIAEIFSAAGEAAFREAEKEALRAVLERLAAGPLVIAVGGGAFVQPENADALRIAVLPVVFLDAPLDELRSRCARDGSGRPLFRDENQFRKLYESRRPKYLEADFCVNTSGLTLEEAADEVVKRLGMEGA
jgi:shikimate kinase